MSFIEHGQSGIARLSSAVSQSSTAMRLVGLLAVLLLVASAALTFRAFQGNPYPYWKTNTDFGGYIEASEKILHGQDPYAYKPCPCNSLYGTTEIHDQTAYPPFFMEMIAVLLPFGENGARLIWLIIGLFCVIGSTILLMRGFDQQLRWQWVFLALGIVGISHLGRNDLYHGQVNFLLLFLITLGIWLHTRNKHMLGGMLLGVAIVIKPFLGIVALYFLWRRAWRMGFAALATSGGLFILSFIPLIVFRGISAFYAWRDASAYYSNGAIAARPDNQSLHGLLMRLFSQNLFTVPWIDNAIFGRFFEIVLLIFLVFLLFVALSRSARAPRTASRLLCEFGLTLGLVMSFGPMTEGDHLFLLIPGFVGVLMLYQQHRVQKSKASKLWLMATASWTAIFALILTPAKISFGLPAQENWTLLAGSSVILTGIIGLMLFLSCAMIVMAFCRDS